jgi:hypothetical protein
MENVGAFETAAGMLMLGLSTIAILAVQLIVRTRFQTFPICSRYASS